MKNELEITGDSCKPAWGSKAHTAHYHGSSVLQGAGLALSASEGSESEEGAEGGILLAQRPPEWGPRGGGLLPHLSPALAPLRISQPLAAALGALVGGADSGDEAAAADLKAALAGPSDQARQWWPA